MSAVVAAPRPAAHQYPPRSWRPAGAHSVLLSAPQGSAGGGVVTAGGVDGPWERGSEFGI